MAVSCAVLFAILALGLTPLFSYTNSDVLVRDTFIPILLDLVIKFMENAAFAVSYALVIYSAVFYTVKKTVALGGIYVLAALVRKLITLGITIIGGATPDASDYSSLAFTLIAEFIQMSAVIIFALALNKVYQARVKEKNKAAVRLGDLSLKEKLEFSAIFSHKNPLHVSALFAGTMITAINVLQRIIYDLFYGVPTGISDVLTMIAYYLSDIFLGLVIYAGIWFISAFLYKKDISVEKRDEPNA